MYLAGCLYSQNIKSESKAKIEDIGQSNVTVLAFSQQANKPKWRKC